jgi:hypothetical protein
LFAHYRDKESCPVVFVAFFVRRIDYTPQEKPTLETLKNGTNKPQLNSNNTKPVIIFDVMKHY